MAWASNTRKIWKISRHSGNIGLSSSLCDGTLLFLFSSIDTDLHSTLKVVFLISSLFTIRTNFHSCDGSWPLFMPISSTKKLWQAKSKLDWSREYALHMTTLGQHPTPSYGDLLQLEYGRGNLTNAQKSLLGEWLLELDDFGMMTATAAKYFSEPFSL